jgi:hypothetical protein
MRVAQSDPEARRAYQAAYRATHREQAKIDNKAWRDANREYVRATNTVWRLAHPIETKAANKAWYLANGETIAAWRKANPDKIALYQRECRLKNYARYLWRGAKLRAIANGIPFELTYEDAARMIDATPICPVLGIPLSPGTKRARANSPSFDCFIPKLGYVAGNVSVISFRANSLKSDATNDEIQLLAAWMKNTTVVNVQPEVTDHGLIRSEAGSPAHTHRGSGSRPPRQRHVVGEWPGYRKI